MIDIKDIYTKVFLKAAKQDYSEQDIQKLRPIWWQNVRGKESGGLRLTQQGLDFIINTAELKTYKIDLPKELTITPQILVWLDQFIECPYFIDKKYIIVLKEKSAFELYLFHGDVRKMGYAKAVNKKINQYSKI